jgi:hypothetical protein
MPIGDALSEVGGAIVNVACCCFYGGSRNSTSVYVDTVGVGWWCTKVLFVVVLLFRSSGNSQLPLIVRYFPPQLELNEAKPNFFSACAPERINSNGKFLGKSSIAIKKLELESQTNIAMSTRR